MISASIRVWVECTWHGMRESRCPRYSHWKGKQAGTGKPPGHDSGFITLTYSIDHPKKYPTSKLELYKCRYATTVETGKKREGQELIRWECKVRHYEKQKKRPNWQRKKTLISVEGRGKKREKVRRWKKKLLLIQESLIELLWVTPYICTGLCVIHHQKWQVNPW